VATATKVETNSCICSRICAQKTDHNSKSRIEFAPMRSRDRSQTVARRSLLLCGVQEKKKKNY
jgi:hypothetical protein